MCNDIPFTACECRHSHDGHDYRESCPCHRCADAYRRALGVGPYGRRARDNARDAAAEEAERHRERAGD